MTEAKLKPEHVNALIESLQEMLSTIEQVCDEQPLGGFDADGQKLCVRLFERFAQEVADVGGLLFGGFGVSEARRFIGRASDFMQ